MELYKSHIKRFLFFFVLFYFPNREHSRCDLIFSAVRELETIFLGGEIIGRCSTLVTLGILGGYHTLLQTK